MGNCKNDRTSTGSATIASNNEFGVFPVLAHDTNKANKNTLDISDFTATAFT
jgi:hypothetical protein